MVHIFSAIKYFNKYGWLYDAERRSMNKTLLKQIKEMPAMDKGTDI